MNINLHHDDLPKELELGSVIAVDTEAMGLQINRDRLCLVQISNGHGDAHLVKIRKDGPKPVRLIKQLGSKDRLKIMHYARFDLAILAHYLDVWATPVYCTKIASKLARTYGGRHGLSDLAKELLGIDLLKQQQTSDWGAGELTQEQLEYAASDVLYLHEIRKELDAKLKRENRFDMLQPCLDFLVTRVQMDLNGWKDMDIFSHG